jgi:prevent-host-death family protein
MRERKVGIRELKSSLSACLKEVKSGRAIVITERGKPVGRISPIEESLELALEQGIQSRLWSWSGRKWKPAPPKVRGHGNRLVSDLLLEDR